MTAKCERCGETKGDCMIVDDGPTLCMKCTSLILREWKIKKQDIDATKVS